ncbi:MAG: hypothetical protein H0W66_09225 [Chthoniobacterales bacterium]|nr:hypothetical protein [Chthoniobacterales bacterium]
MILNHDLQMFATMNGVDRTPDHAMGLGTGATRGGDHEVLQHWEETQALDLEAVALGPDDVREAATLGWLTTGACTVIVRGSGGTSGVGLIDAYAVQ